MKFIQAVITNEIDIRNKKSQDIDQSIFNMELPKKENSYKYLLNLPMNTLTEENITKLKIEQEKLQKQYNDILNISKEEMYIKDLTDLESSMV
jgi:hypothetical protein